MVRRIFILLTALWIIAPLTGARADGYGSGPGILFGSFLWPGSLVPVPNGGGGGGSPGGTPNQIQYNNAGSFGGFTVTGDGTINTSTGVLTITKTNGASFGPFATQAVPCLISQGCTGATTATAARTALSAAASGVNTDITSITGLTTPLPITEGGCGATTGAGCRSNIGAAASGTNADITVLSTTTTANALTSATALPLNHLATATGAYAMGTNQLNGLAPGITGSLTSGDAVAMGQPAVFFNDLGNTSVNRVINPMAARALVAGTSSTFLTMGALMNGSNDDTVAIDNAILAAEGISTPGGSITNSTKQRVYLPAAHDTTSCYFHSQPIRLLGPYLEFGGDGASQPRLCQNYVGFAVDDESWGSNNLAYTTGLVGGGHALLETSAVNNIVLSDVLNSGVHNIYNDSAFDFSGEINISTINSGDLFSIQTGAPLNQGATNDQDRNVIMQVNSSGQVECIIDTIGSGRVAALSSDTGFTTGANHFWRYDYDGSNLRCYRDGTLVVGPLAATGKLTVETRSGTGTAAVSTMPDGGGNNFPYGNELDTPIFGTFDIFDAENQSCQTAGNCTTVPNAKVTAGAHTILAINYESTCAGEGVNTGCSLDGFQLAKTGMVSDGSGTENVFLKVQGTASANTGVPYNHIHDMELCALNVTGAGYGNGLYSIGGNNSQYDHLNCSSFTKNAFDMSLDYESWFHDNKAYYNNNIVGIGGLCYLFSEHYGESVNTNNYCDSAAYGDVHQGDEWTEDDLMTFASRGAGVVQSIFNGTQFTDKNMFDDLESTDSTWIANIFLSSSGGKFETPQLNTRNAAAYAIEIGNAQPGVTYDTPLWGTFGTTTPPNEYIDHTDVANGTQTPTGPDTIINPQPVCYLPASTGLVTSCFNNNGTIATGAVEVSVTNPANWAVIIGDAMSGGRCPQYIVAGGSAGTSLNAPTCGTATTNSSIFALDCAACTATTSCGAGGSSGHPCMVSCNGSNWIETGIGYCIP